MARAQAGQDHAGLCQTVPQSHHTQRRRADDVIGRGAACGAERNAAIQGVFIAPQDIPRIDS
eukprot:9459698-Prorocentrum_lima.AAC.1